MKSIKVFFNGKRLKDIYPYATKWEVFKYRAMQIFRKILFIITLALISIGVGFIIRYNFPKQIIVVAEKVVEVDNLSTKVKELKAEVLDSLRFCESTGYNENDGLIIYDSNKIASIGLYQFQKKTVIYYYKTIYNKEITGKEAIEIALSEKDSRKLAEDIIFTDSKGIDNWYNCKKKKDLGSKVEFIKKLI